MKVPSVVRFGTAPLAPELVPHFPGIRNNNELVKAGIMKPGDCDGMTPSLKGKRVAFDGPDRKVIDGPFAHPRELVTGYWLWTVKDMDEAVAWVKRCPNPMAGPSEIEIRPMQEMEDFQ